MVLCSPWQFFELARTLELLISRLAQLATRCMWTRAGPGEETRLLESTQITRRGWGGGKFPENIGSSQLQTSTGFSRHCRDSRNIIWHRLKPRGSWVSIHVSKLQTCRPLHGLGKLRSILALYCSHRGQWFIFPSGKGRLWKRKKTWPSRTHHKWQENGFEEPVPVYPMSTRSCPAYSTFISVHIPEKAAEQSPRA